MFVTKVAYIFPTVWINCYFFIVGDFDQFWIAVINFLAESDPKNLLKIYRTKIIVNPAIFDPLAKHSLVHLENPIKLKKMHLTEN